ncbi:MAG: UxaA family hydrolase, partial [Rhizobium sp.]|uniref:UxaA family hydrolase n=1 Tax=Rhizobium sp. TaxID=391 RepID=UPI003899B665
MDKLPWIILSAGDNVAVATAAIAPGSTVAGIQTREKIDPGHKVAIADIPLGSPVVKYGQAIGRTTAEVKAGDHVHSHNLHFENDRLAATANSAPEAATVDDVGRTFMGYRRADGRAATRNYIGIIASVNCSTTVCRAIADEANRMILPHYEGIDGFVPIVHDQGCGMSSTGDGMNVLHRTLAGYTRHVNFGGVLMIGLGCEVNQLTLYGQSGAGASKRHFNIQDAGGSRRAVERAMGMLREIAADVGKEKRVPMSIGEIIIGLQCGGSDGFSGITANPALGAAMDILVRHGGTAILSETPEIHGVEYMLTRRAVTPEVGQKLLDRLEWWKEYTRGQNAQFNGVVGHGNQQGGLANIFEKSLGSAMKGGTTPLQAVYEYAEPIDKAGFVFMDSPGYDPVASTGQIASGANLICFTTGRGSMFGSKPAPTIKLASNTPMYRHLEEDMDINCGQILDGAVSVQEMGRLIFEHILR